MSNVVNDIKQFYDETGITQAVGKFSKETLKQYIEFRVELILEELDELVTAVDGNDPEEIVDALIDISVVALGTLDNFQVDVGRAWSEVMRANMTKRAGIKEGRPNPFGLPDLMKPEGWVGPSHSGNHGLFSELKA